MYDFKEIQNKAREIWKIHDKEIKKALQDDSKKPLFSFLEGPPTANAAPGLHHLEVRTFKDVICKFKFMNGFSVPRKGGWDCHGLPVEVQVEKKLGLNSKKDILNYGETKFIQNCKTDVFSNIKEWNKSTEELGYWIDLENPYKTLDNNYIESVWWALSELYKKNLLYEGFKVVHFCPRCQTPLSSHEVAQGYKDVKEESVYIAFKLKNEKNSYILAWTTTPWTLPGNVALAIGNKIDYVKVKLSDGDELILGKEKVDLIKGNYKIIKEFKRKDLIGLEYEPLFDIPELKNNNSYKIISADFVTTEDGTGVVHTAGMYGEDDYNVCKENDLPLIHTVNEDGTFNELVPKWKGKFVKSVEKEIIEDLKKRHLLFKTEKFEHSYPFCWRCDSPLLYYAIKSWFIAVTNVKDKLVQLNSKINWYPNHIQDGRFGVWLENIKDWNLSRFKFWGTPLPVWRCTNEECNEEKIIGSVEELKKYSTKHFNEYDLHRPWIDEIKIKCKCGKEMIRVPDVIDCWFDSGSATFAQFHYPFENKKEFEKRFPYDFISEAIDQTRGWFYTMHAISTMLFQDISYKNVICAGHIVDENGEKMSKSKGNIIKPEEIFNQAGIDAVRLQFCTTDPGNFKRFSLNMVKESVLPFLTILTNSQKYYLQLEDKKNNLKIEDKWILSKLNSLIKSTTENLENYSLDKALLEIIDFVTNDLSRGYIRLTRERNDTKEIIKEILEKVSLLLAPYAPYVSEYIYSEFENKQSVHLSNWPKIEIKEIDKELEKEFENILKIIEMGLSERDKSGIGLKWPLNLVTIYCNKKVPEKYNEIIQNQLNVKNIEYVFNKEENIQVKLDTQITPELEEEGYCREMSRKVQAFRKEIGLEKTEKIDLIIYCSKKLKKIFEKQKNFILDRTNSKKIEITEGESKEKTNLITEFKIKQEIGNIQIVRVTRSNKE
ncbi:MAG: isoleucine--tRNA ligase [Candidatus Pacearchaeota archaeon]|jgi:isoleucyl-tRNA synthetase